MKEELKLVEPTIEYKEQVMEYRKIFLDNNEKLSGCAELEDVTTYEDWIDFDNRRSKIYGKEYVPATVCLCVRAKDNKLVGIIDFRHDLTEFLQKWHRNPQSQREPETSDLQKWQDATTFSTPSVRFSRHMAMLLSKPLRWRISARFSGSTERKETSSCSAS